MESGECDELEFVSHCTDFLLKFLHGGDIEMFSPVEGGGAVIGEHFAWEFCVDGVGETFCVVEVGV